MLIPVTESQRSLLAQKGRSPLATGSELPQIYTTVVTFWPHPREFFSGQPRALLTPIAEKAQQLKVMGVDQLVRLPFDRELASLTPQDFVDVILVRQLGATRVSVGQDFRFGHGRTGTAEHLRAIAAHHGIEVIIVPLETCAEERISSSGIREALQSGDIARANRLLGHPYTLLGDVVAGAQLGRKLGFPTANLRLPSDKFLPRQGVYSAWAYLAHDPAPLPAVMNLGNRPTVDGLNQTVEVHLLDWSGDLYGQTLTVCLESFLRPEQKFDSLESLTAQIHLDCEQAKASLSAKVQA